MTQLKLILASLGLTFVAGCATTSVAPITGAPVDPQYTAAGRGLESNGINLSEVRAYKSVSGSKTELTGVPCELKTPYYVTKVVTPALVKIPSYAEKTPSLQLSCTHDGKTVKKTLNRINSTVEQRSGKWYTPGLLGVALVAATTSAENSVYRYPFTTVTFE